jgi:hypothetical protein
VVSIGFWPAFLHRFDEGGRRFVQRDHDNGLRRWFCQSTSTAFVDVDRSCVRPLPTADRSHAYVCLQGGRNAFQPGFAKSVILVEDSDTFFMTERDQLIPRWLQFRRRSWRGC